jgi:mannitol-1-/sugar-/sorbitol-6-phosphatase
MTHNPILIPCDAVLFDLDGVLIDSNACIVRHWQHWAGRHGLDPNIIMSVAHGIRTVETIRLVAPHLDAEAEAEEFTVQEVADTDGVIAIEGAAHLLSGLPPDVWAIVTSGSAALARARLLQAGLPIPRVLVTGDDVKDGKPAPEPYLVGARRLEVPVERCVVIEDAPAGVTSGRTAGIRVIGVCSTHTREELLERGAGFTAESLTQLRISKASGDARLVVML